MTGEILVVASTLPSLTSLDIRSEKIRILVGCLKCKQKIFFEVFRYVKVVYNLVSL